MNAVSAVLVVDDTGNELSFSLNSDGHEIPETVLRMRSPFLDPTRDFRVVTVDQIQSTAPTS